MRDEGSSTNVVDIDQWKMRVQVQMFWIWPMRDEGSSTNVVDMTPITGLWSTDNGPATACMYITNCK